MLKPFVKTLTIVIALSFFSASLAVARDIVPMKDAPASFADLTEKLLPTVVNISSTQKIEQRAQQPFPDFPEFPDGSPFQDFFEEFMGRRGGVGPAVPPASLGSGFVIDAKQGYIVTNNHVIRDADEVRVTFYDDTTYTADIIGRDEKTDLAVLKIDTDKPLIAAKFGNSDPMRVGDWVIAIGNPFGLGGTVTAGIISARQRNIDAGPYDDFIQTDASINKGNSGGPMFNLDGEVIGINTAIFSPSGGSVGIGFAIPSVLAQPVINQLIKYGKTRRGWLGVKIQTVTEEIAESLELDSPRGALIASTNKDGPADKAGLQAGDIILGFNGKPIKEMRELPRIVAETDINSKAPLIYWRAGKKETTKVTVGELEKAEAQGSLSALSQNPNRAGQTVKIDSVGIEVSPLEQDGQSAVVITGLEPNKEGAAKGLATGDIILEMNQKPVKTPQDVDLLFKRLKKLGNRSVLLLVDVQGSGDTRFVALRLR